MGGGGGGTYERIVLSEQLCVAPDTGSLRLLSALM